MSKAGVSAGDINIAQSGNDAVVDFGGDSSIRFVDQFGNISVDDFVF